MHDASARGEPLNVTRAEPCDCSERVGMVDETVTHDGYRFEAPMRMLRKSWHLSAMIHPPSSLALKVLANVPSGQRSCRSQLFVAGGIGVVVIHAKQKWIRRFPWNSKRFDDHKTDSTSE